MTPRLRGLAQQLMMTEVSQPEVKSNRRSDQIMASLQSLVEDEAKERVAEAQEMVKEEKAENANLRTAIAGLQKDLLQMQKEMMAKLEAMTKAHKQECDQMCREHQKEMKAQQNVMDSLRQLLADEQTERVKAETRAATSEKMNADYAKMASKPTAPMQRIVAPTSAPVRVPKRYVAKPQRNELGQIVTVTYTPEY